MRLDNAQVSNGGEAVIDLTIPYTATIRISGVCPLLFHAWNNEAVQAKAGAAKGSRAKKSDDLESYVYRDERGMLAMPTMNCIASLVEAGRYMQDPRSPRKSLRDLLKGALVPQSEKSPFLPERDAWDYVDRRRVTVQRAGITRERPALNTGWELEYSIIVTVPQYVTRETLAELVTSAGRLVGLADFRPTYGRYTCVGLTIS